LAFKIGVVVAAAIGVTACGPSREELAVNAARDAVKVMLSDPASAQFQYEVVGDEVVCGFVNAKNSFGGYGGFKSFVVEVDVHDRFAIAKGTAMILGENMALEAMTIELGKCPGSQGEIARSSAIYKEAAKSAAPKGA
jgi:hypothetical protein